MRECVARLKFHFGADTDIFNDKYVIERHENGMVYVYEK